MLAPTSTRIVSRGLFLARPITTTAVRAFPASDLAEPGKPADIRNDKYVPFSPIIISFLTLLPRRQHPDQVKRGNEPANDAELDPKKSSEGGASGSASFARSTKEPDAAKKPVSPGVPGTNKLD